MYYVIETQYVGPNQEQYVDADKIEISTSPAIYNSSHEECVKGYCGTTNDWAVYAHGEYSTIEEARAAIAEIFGNVRESDDTEYESRYYDDGVVELYKPGEYIPMGRNETEAWAYDGFRLDIDVNTTDYRIGELDAEYEAAANEQGWTLHDDLEVLMREYRQGLRDELED